MGMLLAQVQILKVTWILRLSSTQEIKNNLQSISDISKIACMRRGKDEWFQGEHTAELMTVSHRQIFL